MWVELLPAIQTIKNIRTKLRLIENAPDFEQLCDYLCELRYALIFKYVGFGVEAEPLGGEGPDFSIERESVNIMLECTRFRHVYPGPAELDSNDFSQQDGEYGDIKRDTEKAFSKIIGKFKQINAYDSIIAIWNNEGDLEELEVANAISYIKSDSAAGRLPVPQGLLAVVYGSGWQGVGTGKQVYCFELTEPQPPISHWFWELRNVDIENALLILKNRYPLHSSK